MLNLVVACVVVTATVTLVAATESYSVQHLTKKTETATDAVAEVVVVLAVVTDGLAKDNQHNIIYYYTSIVKKRPRTCIVRGLILLYC